MQASSTVQANDENAKSKNVDGAASEKPSGHPIPAVLELLVRHVDGLQISFPFTLGVLHLSANQSIHHLNEFLSKHYPTEMAAREVFQIRYEHLYKYDLLNSRAEAAKLASVVVPRTLLVALVSQFDAFIGDLLRALFYLRPESLNMSERTLSFAELVEIGNIDQAREQIVEKEVDSILRKSHAEQFSWLEERFGLPLRKDLQVWKDFIELTERRNLFVHANGAISKQYLKVCKLHDVDLPAGIGVSDQLNVDEAYFIKAHNVIYELGVKLAHVLWRKQHPDQLEDADTNLIGVTFRLLQQERFELATNLLHFATRTLKKHGSEQSRRRLVVNLAQAYTWSGKGKESKAIMAAEDWSATGLDFQLVKAVLEDDYTNASDIMRRIGSDGQIKMNDYNDWPIFRKFRESVEFLEAFRTIFGEDFEQYLIEERDVTITLVEGAYQRDAGSAVESSSSSK